MYEPSFNLSVLLRRKKIILLTGLVTACLALAVTKILPIRYVSDSGLVVENSQPASAELGMGTGNMQNSDIVLTQRELLHSRGLLDQVVRSMHLTLADLQPTSRLPAAVAANFQWIGNQIKALRAYIDGPDVIHDHTDSAIDYLMKNLSVNATDRSNVISMRFQARDPAITSSVLDGVMKTYLADDMLRRDAQTRSVNGWLTTQKIALANDAADAQQKVTDFIRQHNLPEMQGSSAADIQLSKDQEQLAMAQQAMAHEQAILAAISNGGSDEAAITLDSRTIQALKDREAQTIQQVAMMGQIDPRRAQLQLELNGIRRQIATETNKVAASVRQNAEIARANVRTLTAQVQAEMATSQHSAVDKAELVALQHTAEAKQQMYLSFGTRDAQNQLAATQLPSARIVFPATPVPQQASVLMTTLLGFIVGLVSASGLLAMLEVFNTRVKSTMHLEMATGLATSGSLPEIAHKGGRLLLNNNQPLPDLVLETLRAMANAMRPIGGVGATVVVTSSDIGEGKTTVAKTFAQTVASDGYRVLLIDADLRRPRLAAAFGVRPDSPLEAMLAGDLPLDHMVVQDPITRIDCLFANGASTNPIRLIGSNGFKRLLSDCARQYDYIILDSPPVLRVTDALRLAEMCKHVLFVVASGQMPAKLVNDAIHRFTAEDQAKIMTLLTRVPPRDLNQGDYFSGYGRS